MCRQVSKNAKPARVVWRSRRLGGVLLLVVSSTFAAGCYGAMPPSRVAKLRVVAAPDDTTVYVDDQFIGSARVLAVQPRALRPGVKFITFKAPKHFPHDVRVDLPEGTTTIEMKLRPIPE
jgi:hypothetical protein